MSELTPCNYCSLQRLKREHIGKFVEAKQASNGWLEVYADDQPVGVAFMALTDHCVC